MTKRLLVKKHGKIISELAREINVGDIITVGNDPSAVIELDEEGILPEQLVIINETGKPLLLCRTDGILVNDEFLQQGAIRELLPGDKILIGNYSLQYDEKSLLNLPENGAEAPPTAITEDLQPPEFLSDLEAKNAVADKASVVPREQTLTDILENLRAEEKYYFQIENISGAAPQRVYVENENMLVGWTANGECAIANGETSLETPKAQIRKDWTGVILYPQAGEIVWLNNETLTAPRRLKNDDRILLSGQTAGEPERATLIKFHEPTALLVLDSILPKELPPPVSLEAAGQPTIRELTDNNFLAAEETATPQTFPTTPKTKSAARIFGYFTLMEIVIMLIGTLVTAAVIFLVLELSY